MNGIRYLTENIEWGVVTALTEPYRAAVLRKTQSRSLDEAEAKLIARATVDLETYDANLADFAVRLGIGL
jgi:hypothetical protein